jgi:hypothetical protein
MSNFIKESVMERSDMYSMYVSENTGQIAIGNPNKNRFVCPNVDGPLEYENEDDINTIALISLNSKTTNILKVNIPYSFKQMVQECEAMSISMRLITNPTPIEEKLVLKQTPTLPNVNISIKPIEKIKAAPYNILTKSTSVYLPGNYIIIKDDSSPYNNLKAMVINKMRGYIYKLRVIDDVNSQIDGTIIKMNIKSLIKFTPKIIPKVLEYALDYEEQDENLRIDIFDHIELWKNYNKKKYTFEEISKFWYEKAYTYNLTEMSKLNIPDVVFIRLDKPTGKYELGSREQFNITALSVDSIINTEFIKALKEDEVAIFYISRQGNLATEPWDADDLPGLDYHPIENSVYRPSSPTYEPTDLDWYVSTNL